MELLLLILILLNAIAIRSLAKRNPSTSGLSRLTTTVVVIVCITFLIGAVSAGFVAYKTYNKRSLQSRQAENSKKIDVIKERERDQK